MILNTQKWQETIKAAKAKSAGNAALLRAIERAVVEIEKAVYWSFVAGILRRRARHRAGVDPLSRVCGARKLPQLLRPAPVGGVGILPVKKGI
jgi:hypothetical protein